MISLLSKGLKSLLQHHNSIASILLCSAFFMVQLSYLYMITGKTGSLTMCTTVGKVMSLLFNMLSMFVIAFLSQEQSFFFFLQASFNSRLQSLSTVILEPKKIVCHCLQFFPFYLPLSDGTGCHDLSYLKVEFHRNFFTFLFHFHQEAL